MRQAQRRGEKLGLSEDEVAFYDTLAANESAVERRDMSTEIKTWQVVDGKLIPVNSALADVGRKEAYDSEEWMVSNEAKSH